ncbi:DNA-directed RNA polymerase [Auriculariales sp. MPI-PUGE-AT-0066]|nr:DNA-directed RNA polymerase [Auriculariales sp. MPI-PUGE-AT-0066]
MVRAQLLAMPGILFAGYKVPHPLEPYFILKVQTDGTKTPNEAVQHACSELIKTISSITEQFKRGFGRAEMDDSTDLRQGASMGIHQPWATSNNDYVDFQ